MNDALFDVRDRVFVITGAGGALCGVMAEGLAERGARVALLDIDEAAATARATKIQESGGSAIGCVCSVLAPEEIESALETVLEAWGKIDVLINGAGGNHPSGSTTASSATPELLMESATAELATTFFDLPVSGFEHVFDLNFLGTVLPSRILGRQMAGQGAGAIINMSSMSALTPLTRVGAYSAAKAAVASITRWLAVHLAPVGVRVNALAPGFFMTEQLKFLHIDQETGELTPRAKAVMAHTPMARYGTPEELLGSVIWLSTPASSFVTGIVLPIDGGFSSFTI